MSLSRFKRPFVAAVTVGFALAFAAQAPSAFAGKPEGFELKTTVTTNGSGGGVVKVAIAVDAEYHWNTEYPAKVEVKGDLPAGATVPQRIFKAKDGAINATPQLATAEIPYVGTSGEILVEAKFSICNDRVCLMKTSTAKVNLNAR